MIEWLEVDAGCVVLATAGGAKLHRVQARTSDPFATPMQGRGSLPTTRALLDGVVAFAAREHREPDRLESSALESSSAEVTIEGWGRRLAGYYHTTAATQRLLPRILASVERAGREDLANWARHKSDAEDGHDRLALRDLTALGYDAESLVAHVVPDRARAWVDLFEKLAEETVPTACLGYAHALERLALARPAHFVHQLERRLEQKLAERARSGAEAFAGSQSQDRVIATRSLRVHSALGSDAGHVDENLAVIHQLCADERRTVAVACLQTARIAFDRRLGREPGPNLARFHSSSPMLAGNGPVNIAEYTSKGAASTAALEHRSG
ncbi:MAG TPA: hypothetical protein VFQ61_28415 [Polyangiaceae bacterium]|nr:hypothetical protein [Polyangiaceae bacterium]